MMGTIHFKISQLIFKVQDMPLLTFSESTDILNDLSLINPF